MRLDRIKIVEYDVRWPALFEEQRRRVEPVLRDYLVRPIEHIGSTSVPGLPAKAIIDMAAEVSDYTACREAFDELGRLGWLHAPEPGDEEARKWSFCYPSIECRSHHLHVFEQARAALPTLLAFRDHLRATPPTARTTRESSENWHRPTMKTARPTWWQGAVHHRGAGESQARGRRAGLLPAGNGSGGRAD